MLTFEENQSKEQFLKLEKIHRIAKYNSFYLGTHTELLILIYRSLYMILRLVNERTSGKMAVKAIV